jgi:hypothetical protein
VGYKLFREVIDFAPADLTSGELVVALVIADDANDRARKSWIPLPLLCARARLKPSAVRAALAKLAARGMEFRVIHGYGTDGRPVFAVKGRKLDFVVPDMLQGASGLAPKPVDNPAPAQPLGASNPAVGASAVAPKRSVGASRLAPLPSEDLYPLTNPSAEALDLDASPVENARTGARSKAVDPRQVLAARQAALERARRENGA